eukprot:1149651-Pelagomonas_calceolata.AAC.2
MSKVVLEVERVMKIGEPESFVPSHCNCEVIFLLNTRNNTSCLCDLRGTEASLQLFTYPVIVPAWQVLLLAHQPKRNGIEHDNGYPGHAEASTKVKGQVEGSHTYHSLLPPNSGN